MTVQETERLQLEIRQLKEDINRPRPSQDSQDCALLSSCHDVLLQMEASISKTSTND